MTAKTPALDSENASQERRVRMVRLIVHLAYFFSLIPDSVQWRRKLQTARGCPKRRGEEGCHVCETLPPSPLGGGRLQRYHGVRR